jgi:hypothetical protein
MALVRLRYGARRDGRYTRGPGPPGLAGGGAAYMRNSPGTRRRPRWLRLAALRSPPGGGGGRPDLPRRPLCELGWPVHHRAPGGHRPPGVVRGAPGQTVGLRAAGFPGTWSDRFGDAQRGWFGVTSPAAGPMPTSSPPVTPTAGRVPAGPASTTWLVPGIWATACSTGSPPSSPKVRSGECPGRDHDGLQGPDVCEHADPGHSSLNVHALRAACRVTQRQPATRRSNAVRTPRRGRT